MTNEDVLEKSEEQLIKDMGTTQNTVFPAQLQTAALRLIATRLITAMSKNSESADRLSRVIIWLNVLILIATIAGVVIACIALSK
jgi:hypothetical protein